MRQKVFIIFLWALTLKYASLVIYCLVSIKLIMYFGLLINVGIVFFCLRFLKFRSPQRSIAILYGLFIIGLTLWGVYNQNWVKFIISDIIIWMMGIVVVIGSRDSNERLSRDLPKWVATWMIFGVPISWYLIFKYQISPADFLLGQRFVYGGDWSGQSYGVFAPIQAIYASVYVLPFFFELKGIRRIAVLLGAGTILIFGLLTVSRQFIIVPLVGFGSIFFTRRKILGSDNFRYLGYLLFLCVFFVSIWAYVYGSATLSTTGYAVIERITNIEENRSDDLRIYWEAQSAVHKLVGRGMGGSNRTWIWEELPYGVAMLHYGFGHVLLKGGIIFVLFIYSLTIFALYNLWRYSGEHCWFWVLIIFLITGFAHTEWGYFFPVIFFWLSISQAVNCSAKLRSSPIAVGL